MKFIRTFPQMFRLATRQQQNGRDRAGRSGNGGSNSMRRVTFVITSMPVGGAETLLVNLMRRFDSRRIQPDIVCLKEPGPLGDEIAKEFPIVSNLIGGKCDVRVLWRLIAHFRDRRSDVVITVGAGDKMFWGRMAAWIAGVPGIASALHSTGWPDGVGRLNRLLDPITDAYIAVADSHGEFLRDFEHFPANKVVVVRNGVDCQRFGGDQFEPEQIRDDVRRELGVSPTTPLVGIVAALRSEKNHSMFVAAAKLVLAAQPDTHYLIIGEGPERATIEAAAKQHGIADRIHLLGNRSDTPRLLTALDVFALSSLNEASPVSILEALACSVPVVATDVGSVAETVRPGQTGCLVESEDTNAMADAIIDLLADGEKRKRFGNTGRQWVARSGSLDAMVLGYTELIERLSTNPPRRTKLSVERLEVATKG